MTLFPNKSANVDKIVSDLQDYARPLRPELEEVDTQALVASVISTLNVPPSIEVTCSDDTVAHFKTDPVLLKRILLNLVTNAIQAMPDGGKLTLQVKREEITQGIILTVADTGVGIPKEEQAHLFSPLFTTKSKGLRVRVSGCEASG